MEPMATGRRRWSPTQTQSLCEAPTNPVGSPRRLSSSRLTLKSPTSRRPTRRAESTVRPIQLPRHRKLRRRRSQRGNAFRAFRLRGNLLRRVRLSKMRILRRRRRIGESDSRGVAMLLRIVVLALEERLGQCRAIKLVTVVKKQVS